MYNQPSQETLPEVFKMIRAIRFVLVVIVLGLSYFSIRFSFSIDIFEDVWAGMNLKLLPVTSFIITARPVLMILSILFPFVALASCCHRNVARSFYIIGGITLLTVVQLILLYQGLSAPMFQLMSNLNGQN
jgi:hypothetical protein